MVPDNQAHEKNVSDRGDSNYDNEPSVPGKFQLKRVVFHVYLPHTR